MADNTPALSPGTAVRYWPGLRRGEGMIGTTLTGLELLGGHSAGYFVRKSNGGSDFISESHIEAATPPVPASPVVPDEPATDSNGLPLHTKRSTRGEGPYYCDECSYAAHDWVGWPCRGVGSPVVPAATDEPACSTCNDTKTVVVYVGGNDVSYTYDAVCEDCPDNHAPAATDDEAALALMEQAVRRACPPVASYVSVRWFVLQVTSDLRSAGFRIVHDNTEAPR